MKLLIAIASLAAAAAAAPDPLITPRPALAGRQTTDPALLGWVDAVNGQFSDQRTCDFPATLSTSGTLAQCCAASSPCIFWSACTAGTLFASQTSLFCDQGYCNTAVIVPERASSVGESYLGCWATSLGSEEFTLIRDIGDGAVVTGTPKTSLPTSSRSTSTSSAEGTEAEGSATRSSTGATLSTSAAAGATAQPFTGVVGLVGLVLGLL